MGIFNRHHSITEKTSDQLNENAVRLAYRLLLGREPESDKVIKDHLSLGTLDELRHAMCNSLEFKSKMFQSNFGASKWVAAEVLERFVMWVDLHDRFVSQGCLNNNWEPNETAFFISKLGSGDCVLDIGANIGWFSLVAAKHIGANGCVHSFEPSPKTSHMLKRTISENDLRSIVQVWEYALSDRNDVFNLTCPINTDNPGGSFLSDKNSAAANHESTPVVAVRLDDLLPDVAPDIIKIDVEGAEPRALLGARNAIMRSKPVILSELFPAQLINVSGMTAAQYISQMEEFGYGCYLLENACPTNKLTDFPIDVNKELVSVVFEWRGS